MARANLALFAALPPAQQWILKDLYSLSLAVALVLLEFLNGQVTTADLTSAATAAGTSSANRARAFVEEARALGLVAYIPGNEVWTQRPLTISPALLEPIIKMTRITLEGAAMVIPEVKGLADRISMNDGYKRFYAAVAMLSIGQDEMFGPPEPEVGFFNKRNGGGRLFEAFVSAQPEGQMERPGPLPLRRSKLAQDMGVSRIHLNRLLNDARNEGYVQFGGRLVNLSSACLLAHDRALARQFEIGFRSASLAGLLQKTSA